MIAEPIYQMPWGFLGKARNVLCPDGKRRATHWIVITADTFFSHPATIKVHGKTVSGHLTGIETNGQRDLKFIPNANGKNAGVFNV